MKPINEIEVRKWLVKKGYKKPVTLDELSGALQAQRVELLGFQVTHADIDKWISVRRDAIQRNKEKQP